jgi:hypothetical protein
MLPKKGVRVTIFGALLANIIQTQKVNGNAALGANIRALLTALFQYFIVDWVNRCVPLECPLAETPAVINWIPDRLYLLWLWVTKEVEKFTWLVKNSGVVKSDRFNKPIFNENINFFFIFKEFRAKILKNQREMCYDLVMQLFCISSKSHFKHIIPFYWSMFHISSVVLNRRSRLILCRRIRDSSNFFGILHTLLVNLWIHKRRLAIVQAAQWEKSNCMTLLFLFIAKLNICMTKWVCAPFNLAPVIGFPCNFILLPRNSR